MILLTFSCSCCCPWCSIKWLLLIVILLLLLETLVLLLCFSSWLCLWTSTTQVISHRWGCHWEIGWILANLMPRLVLIRLGLRLIVVEVFFIILIIIICAIPFLRLGLLETSLVSELILSCNLNLLLERSSCLNLLLGLLSWGSFLEILRGLHYLKLIS